MKRRTFGLLASTSMAALTIGRADAQAVADPALLQTTLTPFGAERAGNADGSIPAWTGGYTTVPDGWQQGDYMPLPDAWANEQPVVVITSANMAQHADKLNDGVMLMMTKYGFSIKVYPTHRSAGAPQSVYDNIAKNVTRAKLINPSDPRMAFQGAIGGAPFPIPDASDPMVAGGQIIMNHLTRWQGYAAYAHVGTYVVTGGDVVLANSANFYFKFPYYLPGNTVGGDGRIYTEIGKNDAPPNYQGEETLTQNFTNFISNPTQTWQLLNGQGRVRKAPEVSFDTPSSFADGLLNYDEYAIFNGSMIKYDWKLIGKKELYVPYNTNEIMAHTVQEAHLTHFLDPNIVRWELHRVWVVEATLHPGERNTIPRRRLYVDEDTWTAVLSDVWDANNNLLHTHFLYNVLRPDLPGTISIGNGFEVLQNLQADSYVSLEGEWNEKLHPTVKFSANLSDTLFDPEAMAASAQY